MNWPNEPMNGWNGLVNEISRALGQGTRCRVFMSPVLQKVQIPSTAVGWMLQILSTMSHVYEVLNPPTGVGGWFRSSLHRITLRLKFLTARILDYREQLERGSEQSTNFRWWDLASSQWFIQSREDLKHPPTAVDGIWTFCAKSMSPTK